VIKNLPRVLMAGLLAIGIVVAVLNRHQFDSDAIQLWINELGGAGPVIFVGAYIIACVLFLPGSLLTLTAGALFGPILGSLYSLIGATTGATLSFLIARYLASGWVEQYSQNKLGSIKHSIEQEGWRFVAFVRLVPIFPFNLLNYALGLTRISLRDYVVTTLLCMIPGAFAYTYLGYAGKEAITGGEDLVQKIILATALLACVAFLPGIVKRVRQNSSAVSDSHKKNHGHGD